MRRPFDTQSAVSLVAVDTFCAVIGLRALETVHGTPDAEPAADVLNAEVAHADAGAEASADGGAAMLAFEYQLAKPDHTFELGPLLNEISDLSLEDDQRAASKTNARDVRLVRWHRE